MPPTTPLTQFADDEATRARTAVGDTLGALAACDAELPALRAVARAAMAAATAARQREAELRAALAVAPLPADADQLVEQLEDNLVEQQSANRAAATTQDALAAAQRRRALLAARLAQREAAATQAVARASAAHADADREAPWRAHVGSDAISDVVSTAGSARDDVPYTAARDRLAALLDEDQTDGLLELLRRRGAEATADEDAALERLVGAETARAEVPDEGGAAVALRRGTHDRVLDRVRTLAVSAEARLAWALERLTGIAVTPGATDPTEVEQGRLDGYRAAALEAAVKERALLAARAGLRGAETDADIATLRRQAEDPDVDPETDPELEEEREAVVAARADRDQAAAEITDADRRALAEWEVAVPGGLRAEVVDFLAAEAVLDELGEIDPKALLTELDDAELALAAALALQAQHTRSARAVDEEITARRAERDARVPLAAERRVAAIRGER